MEEEFLVMKSHGVTRGRHSPPFLLIGLVVVIVILSINYWSASTRLADLQQQDDELRQTFREELQLKKELQANNEMLESRVKKSQETYDSLRQSLDKKEEETLICKEALANSNRDFKIAKSEDEQKVLAVEEKLRRANENITQHLQMHDQDGTLVASLREENAGLSAQLSALRESLNHSPPTVAAAAAAATVADGSTDCNQHCLVLVEAAQARLFRKIAAKYGQDALLVLESADFGIPRRPGKLITGEPPPGKLAEDILVVGRDGKIQSGGKPVSHPSAAVVADNVDGSKDSPQFVAARASSTTAASAVSPPLPPMKIDEVIDPPPNNVVVANVGPAPPDPNDRKSEDNAVVNLDAAVADAAGAVAPKPQLDIDGDVEKPESNRRVDDVVDGDAEAGDDDDDDDAAAAGGKEAVVPAPEIAQQEPLLVQAAPSPIAKDGIDQLHNNLAAEDQQRV